jgi:hypothetical protein
MTVRGSAPAKLAELTKKEVSKAPTNDKTINFFMFPTSPLVWVVFLTASEVYQPTVKPKHFFL